MAAKKTTKPNKAAFVRTVPASVSARDVVAKGKAAGLTFTEKYVYNVRGASKKAKKGASAGRKATPAKTASAGKTASVAKTSTAPHASSADATFRKMILELGLERAKHLLAEVEGKVRRLIAGE